MNPDDRTIAPSHVDLIAVSATVRRSALEPDPDRLLIALQCLSDIVGEHLQAEEEDLADLSDAMRSLVEQGQLRLLAIIDRLIAGAFANADINALFESAALDVALRRQARLEDALLRRLPP